MLYPTLFPRDVLYLYDSHLYNAQKIKTRGESLQNIGVTLIALRGESHIDFRTQCVLMTVAVEGGWGLSLMRF